MNTDARKGWNRSFTIRGAKHNAPASPCRVCYSPGATIDTGPAQTWTCPNGHTWRTTKSATDAHGGWVARFTTGAEKNT